MRPRRTQVIIAAIAYISGIVLCTSDLKAQDVPAKSQGVVLAPDPCWHDGNPDPRDHIACGKAAMLKARFLAGLPPSDLMPGHPAGTPVPRGTGDTTDVLHNELDIEVFPTTQVLTGSNTFTIQSRVDNLTEFTFRLRSNFTVTSGLVNGTVAVPVSVPPDDSTFARVVTLDRPYAMGETFTVTIAYTGTAATPGRDAVEFGIQHNNPIVGTLSEPWYAGTWWPCKDGDVDAPGDNSDVSLQPPATTASGIGGS